MAARSRSRRRGSGACRPSDPLSLRGRRCWTWTRRSLCLSLNSTSLLSDAEEVSLSKAGVIRLCVLSKFEPLPRIEEDPFLKLCRSPVEGDLNDSRSIDEIVYGPSNPDPDS